MIFAILFALVLQMFGTVAHAASCGDVTAFNDATPTDPETIAYTTPSGSNQVLFVFVGNRRTISPNINVPTHAGTTMTAVASEAWVSPIATRLFYLASPAGGTNNVVVDFVGAPLAGTVVIFTCSGVDTSSPIRASNSATGTGTAVTVTVAGVLTGDVVLDLMATDIATTNPTIGASQTNLNTGNDGGEMGWGASQQAGADGGAMSWTTSLSQEWAIAAVAIVPATTTRRNAAPMVMQ